MKVPLADDAGDDDPAHAADDIPSPDPERGDGDEQPDGVRLEMEVVRVVVAERRRAARDSAAIVSLGRSRQSKRSWHSRRLPPPADKKEPAPDEEKDAGADAEGEQQHGR
jgi:hypothetical protein